MGIENEVINFMTQKLDDFGEIPSVHKEEKASSLKKIENFNKFRKNHLRLSRDYVGISEVDLMDYDAYIFPIDHLYFFSDEDYNITRFSEYAVAIKNGI